MRPKFLITIGIPTYNGGARIKTALDSICNQLSPNIIHLIEIVICDNNSSDNTSFIARFYKQNFLKSIFYYKNKINIGYDRNIDKIFKVARGKYVWLLADDDFLERNAISKVINVLIKYKNLRLLQLNFISIDRKTKNIISKVIINQNLLCENAEIFLKNSKGRYGQVSSLIFERKTYIKANIKEYFGTNYIHVYAALKVLLTGQSYIFKWPLVRARLESKNFGVSMDDRIQNSTSGLEILIKMEEMGYSKRISKQLLEESLNYILRVIIYAKIHGSFDIIKLLKSTKFYHNRIKFWIVMILVYVVPKSILNLIYNFKKYFLNNENI